MPPNTVAYSQLIEDYLKHRNDFGNSTAVTARHSVNRFAQWIGVRELTPANLQMFSETIAKQYEPSYVDRVVKHVQYFTAWMTRTGYFTEDPGLAMKRPRLYHKEPKPGYTKEEYHRLCEFFSKKPLLRAFVIIAYHTGMAMVDVCNLRWTEVSLEKMLITQVRSKMAKRTRSTAIIPIIAGSDLEMELRRLQQAYPPSDGQFVEPGLNAYYMGQDGGGNKCGNTLKWQLHNACKKLGMENKGTHGFRRGLCTALANNKDVNLIHASAVSGHRSVDMLNRYVTKDPEEVRNSVEGILRKHFLG